MPDGMQGTAIHTAADRLDEAYALINNQVIEIEVAAMAVMYLKERGDEYPPPRDPYFHVQATLENIAQRLNHALGLLERPPEVPPRS